MSAKNPVLLVHGIDDTGMLFRHLVPQLERHGIEAHALNLLPNNGSVGLDRLAGQIVEYVRARLQPGQRFDVVGFSMGGLVARYYIQRLDGIAKVERLITISSPHQGTWTAFCRYNEGARQMRPGSAFIRNLNRDSGQLCRTIAFTSIWSRFDLMIVPARSSLVPAARNVCVNVPAHAVMVNNPRVQSLILRALSE